MEYTMISPVGHYPLEVLSLILCLAVIVGVSWVVLYTAIRLAYHVRHRRMEKMIRRARGEGYRMPRPLRGPEDHR